VYRNKKLKNGRGPTKGCRATTTTIIIIIYERGKSLSKPNAYSINTHLHALKTSIRI
jgi:hypothetical protein